MYSVTTNILERKLPKFVGAGIQELELVDVEVKTSPSGKPLFAYVYENGLKQRLVKTEWEINFPENMHLLPVEKQKAYEAVRNTQMKRILKVATLFFPKEEIEGKVFASFLEFITFVKGKIGNNFKGVKLRIKATYDKNGWITTPSYVYDDNEWIERIDMVPESASRIKITNSDKMIREEVPAMSEKRQSSSLIDDEEDNGTVTPPPTSTEDSTDDLPF